MSDRMTIEKLARMTQAEFLALREEMVGIHGAFNQLEKKMDERFFALLNRMDAGFTTMAINFEEVNKNIDSLKFAFFIDRGWSSGEVET